jgi:hypothetical protein
MTSDWPHEAARAEAVLAGLRIPVVRTLHPAEGYVACLLACDPALHGSLWRGFYPDKREAAQFRAFLEWQLEHLFSPWERREMAARPFDMPPAWANTTVLWKRAPDGDWCYRHATWTTGPAVQPAEGSGWSLEQVLDRESSRWARWLEWKARHAAFSEETEGTP